MAIEWTGSTAVQAVEIRAVGEVDGHVDVTHAGTPEAIVTVTMGPVLARIYQADVAYRIREGWQSGALFLHRLPEALVLDLAGPIPTPVGIVVRIGDDVASTSALIPATRNLARDAHTQVGGGRRAGRLGRITCGCRSVRWCGRSWTALPTGRSDGCGNVPK